jgi:hypothetical protein
MLTVLKVIGEKVLPIKLFESSDNFLGEMTTLCKKQKPLQRDGSFPEDKISLWKMCHLSRKDGSFP